LRFFDLIVKICRMFFILSKTLAVLLEPLAHPYIMLVLAGLMRLLRRRRTMRVCLVMAVILPLLYATLPLSTVPLRMLEDHHAIPRITQQVDGIIVLGGHTGDGWVSQTRNQAQQNAAADRMTKAIMLHRQQPQAMLIFSGFSGRLMPHGWNEAEIGRRLLAELGVSETTVLFEVTSRNTYENAVYSMKVAVPQPGSRWILVTSAAHMPRAVTAFTAAGWDGIIPYPTDFQTATTGTALFSFKIGVRAVRNWLREYVGIAIYWVTGRTSSPFG
jgi:uncharacterized SAM-binding protein YcdF (DUF218 family)